MKRKFDIKNAIIFLVAITSIVLLFFYIKDIVLDIIKLHQNDDLDNINTVLAGKGVFGYLAIVLIEAMQMVVVVVSTSFIQIAAGLAYPWYIAIPLSIFGIFAGSSIIFLLVRMFKFQPNTMNSSQDKIKDKLQQRKKTHGSIQTVMYLMFVAPIIPLGAIAYYGAASKISYRRYILTCTTGCIPDILVSVLFGNIIKVLLVFNIPFLYILIAAVLFIILIAVVLVLVVRKMYFKQNLDTPDSVYYSISFKPFFSKDAVDFVLHKNPNTLYKIE